MRQRFSKDAPVSEPGPDVELEREEDRQVIYAALDSLKPEHRIAVSLSCMEGLSTTEIAAIMGCQLGTVYDIHGLNMIVIFSP